ncbi:MAG: flagellar filament capping protein FliD [Pirellula sp.]|jgi:flagellar hook-associated protein 2|nr:flagellar filament capping protein FliD [Pirellula sp.]
MGRIQSNVGIVTGIDIQSTIEQLMTVSSRPKTLLENRVAGLKAQQIALTELTALVVGVQLQSDRLGLASNMNTTTATSSRPETATVALNGNPTPGNYSVRVLQTAQTATASSSPIASSTESLPSGEFSIRTGGFVDSSASLDDLRGGLGVSRGRIKITDRSGQNREVDLRFASSMEDVLQAINSSGLRVSARSNGDRIVLNDLTGQTNSNLIVEDIGDGRTAADLGLGGINVASNSASGEDLAFITATTRLSSLRDGRGLSFGSTDRLKVDLKDGSSIDIGFSNDRPASVSQFLKIVNELDPNKLEMRIAANGDGFEIIDKTTGTAQTRASGGVANQLGFTDVSAVNGSITGARVQGSLQGPLLSSLQGGKGIGTPGLIAITNRNQQTTSVDLSGTTSLREVIDRINASGAGVTASLNRSRTGLVLQDVTGATNGNLVIANADSNNTATKLGIEANTASNSIDSNSLNLQYISQSTQLSQLNQGRGVKAGAFTMTNSNGQTATVNINATSTRTIGDVITAINQTSIGITAKLNNEGDGILITDTTSGGGSFTITDDGTGTSARELGIRGTGSTSGDSSNKVINGRQTFTWTNTDTEDIEDLVKKINDSNGPVVASLLRSSDNSVRMVLTSKASGSAGRIFADGSAMGLNISSTGVARDAIVSVGGTSETGGILVRSSSNSINNAVDGVTITALQASNTPFDVTVATNNSTLERNLQLFVDQYNKVRDKIKKDTAFNADTRSTGILIGSGEILRVEQALSRLVTQRSFSTGRIQSLQQLGVSFNQEGNLEFDRTRLAQAVTLDEEGVKNFLTKETTGFGARAKVVLDGLVGVNGSSLVNRTKSIQQQIDLNDRRIAGMNVRLAREKERLEKQFFDLENTIGKIRNNSSSLSSINSLFGSTNAR